MSYVIYAEGHRPPDCHRRVYVPIFQDPVYACAWLAKFLDGQEYLRTGNLLTLGSGTTIKSDRLDELLSVRADDGILADEDKRLILRFKYGTWDEVHVKDDPITDDGIEKASPRRERSAKAHKPDGYVTITELCAASGVPACDARALLRASGRDKPTWGWAFAPSELNAIKKLIGIG